MNRLSLFVFAVFFIGCTVQRDAAPVADAVLLRTYDVPPALSKELESVLRSAFWRPDAQPRLGNVALTPNGQLLVAAPEGIQKGVGELVEKVKKAPAAAPHAVEMEYWIVVGKKGERTEGKAVAPEIADVLDALQQQQGPMQMALLDHLTLRSISGEHSEVVGRSAWVQHKATVRGSNVLAWVDVRRDRGGGKIITTVELAPDKPVVFAQAGVELVEGDPMFNASDRQVTAFLVVRAAAVQ